MTTARVIGRILSLGYPMPGVLVDNYNLLSAPSLFDYDAVVVDPRAAARYVEDVLAGAAEGRTFAGERIAVGSSPGLSIEEILTRRAEEAHRLLDRGGVIVVFAHAPEPEREGPRLDRWLPLAGASSGPLLVRAEGSQVNVVDYEHPLAAFISSQLANVLYRAEASSSTQEAKVFARSSGGAAVGFEVRAGNGRVIVLPALKAPPAGDKRYASSELLQAGIRRARGVTAPGRTPSWVAGQRPIPGLTERETALNDARRTRGAAEEAVLQAEARFDELARFQRLLWQEGAQGLDPVVFEALRLLGFEVHDRDPHDLQVRTPGGYAYIEIEASEHPVDMAAHHRLRQRIERAIDRRGEAPRGILFVNGQRLMPPTERAHVTDALRVAAETMRYCIAPTAALYDAVVSKLAEDAEAVEAFKQRLIATDGLLS